jgi:hypothetical protein
MLQLFPAFRSECADCDAFGQKNIRLGFAAPTKNDARALSMSD